MEQNCRILVIDDEYGIRSGVRQVLELEGYEVMDAETGRQAIDILTSEPLDIVLIDYRLPDIDGLTLLRTIKKRGIDVMTCMITAYANIETAITATRQGVDFFLPKPFTPDDLLGVVETLNKHKALRKEAEQLRRAHEASLLALASEKSQTHSLVASLRDGVLVVNGEGEVVLANPAMAAILDDDEEKLLRRPYDQVLSADCFAGVREVLAQGKGAVGRTGFEVERDDSHYLVSVVPFRTQDGEVLGYIINVSDISAVRRLAMDKARFIRTTVHELRSPLGTIKSVLSVVKDRSLGDSLEPYLPLLDRVGVRLDGLVELIGDLLTLSRIDMAGRQGGRPEKVDVAGALKEVTGLYGAQMEQSGISLELDVHGGEPTEDGKGAGCCYLFMDPDDFRTIMTNLVGNAVKYNRPGGKVMVSARPKGDQVHVEVADTGLGIKAENVDHIFDEFFREKRRETKDLVGNGIGLSIVKRLVERYSGRIGLKSEEGAGSTFSVVLPAAHG